MAAVIDDQQAPGLPVGIGNWGGDANCRLKWALDFAVFHIEVERRQVNAAHWLLQTELNIVALTFVLQACRRQSQRLPVGQLHAYVFVSVQVQQADLVVLRVVSLEGLKS